MQIIPRNLYFDNLAIRFSSIEPAHCNQCSEKIRREIIEVRNIHTSAGSKQLYDTVIMCGCMVMVGMKSMATFKETGQAPDAWVETIPLEENNE